MLAIHTIYKGKMLLKLIPGCYTQWHFGENISLNFLSFSRLQLVLWCRQTCGCISRSRKAWGIAFCCVAKVLSSMKLIKCQETELNFSLPCQAGIAQHPFGKGATSGQEACDSGNKIHITIHWCLYIWKSAYIFAAGIFSRGKSTLQSLCSVYLMFSFLLSSSSQFVPLFLYLLKTQKTWTQEFLYLFFHASLQAFGIHVFKLLPDLTRTRSFILLSCMKAEIFHLIAWVWTPGISDKEQLLGG